MKLARQAFLWEGDVALADFYERALWNGILGNQNRNDDPNRNDDQNKHDDQNRNDETDGTGGGALNSNDKTDGNRIGGDAGGGDTGGGDTGGANTGGGATSYIYMLPLGGVQRKPWGKS